MLEECDATKLLDILHEFPQCEIWKPEYIMLLTKLEEYTIACNVLLFFTQYFSCIITHRRTLFSNLEFLAQLYEAAMIQISFENSQYKVGQRNLVS